jgi:hypothetical protein
MGAHLGNHTDSTINVVIQWKIQRYIMTIPFLNASAANRQEVDSDGPASTSFFTALDFQSIGDSQGGVFIPIRQKFLMEWS